MNRPKTLTAVLTIAILLVLSVLAGLVVVYSGLASVGASKPEGIVAGWVVATTMVHSVRRQASAISPDLTRADLAEGAEHYEAMCVVCHGAPGRDRDEIGLGLNPSPPDLRLSPSRWEPGEIYWIVENGIKMTGMPAFGRTHSPEQLTNITAFIEKLPTMTAEEYRQLAGSERAETKPSGPEPSHDYEHSHH